MEDRLRPAGVLGVVAYRPEGCAFAWRQAIEVRRSELLRAASRRWPRFDLETALTVPEPWRENVLAIGLYRNLVVTTGEAYLVDAWQGLVTLSDMKYHGLGTGTTSAAEGNTGLETELTTQYNPNSTRATGSTTEAGASVFRTVATNTLDGSATIAEWGLFSAASAGTMFARVLLLDTYALVSGQSIQTTYDLTVE